jgi:prefoldin subunit 4
MASSAGSMLTREEESEAEVRREDQENINKFGRLNARLHECREELALIKVRNDYLNNL